MVSFFVRLLVRFDPCIGRSPLTTNGIQRRRKAGTASWAYLEAWYEQLAPAWDQGPAIDRNSDLKPCLTHKFRSRGVQESVWIGKGGDDSAQGVFKRRLAFPDLLSLKPGRMAGQAQMMDGVCADVVARYAGQP